MKRRGHAQAKEERFPVADARKAGLRRKPGLWTTYPRRMLRMRARGFLARDLFADKLGGLISREEAADYEGAVDAVGASAPALAERAEMSKPANAGSSAQRTAPAESIAPAMHRRELPEVGEGRAAASIAVRASGNGHRRVPGDDRRDEAVGAIGR